MRLDPSVPLQPTHLKCELELAQERVLQLGQDRALGRSVEELPPPKQHFLAEGLHREQALVGPVADEHHLAVRALAQHLDQIEAVQANLSAGAHMLMIMLMIMIMMVRCLVGRWIGR